MIHSKSGEEMELHPEWLLFFYSVPSKPVNARIKIWRRLAKAGAVQLKGAVYILPYNEDHYEFLQWIVSEVTALKGDGTFIIAEKVETMTNSDISNLFNQQRETDYRRIEKSLEEFERKISSITKGTGLKNSKALSGQFNKYLKEFEEIRKIDFFSSIAGNDLKKKIKNIEAEIKGVSGAAFKARTAAIVAKRIGDYQAKTWVTRAKPFVDRMASAWLIKKFIDKDAGFKFIREQNVRQLDDRMIAFDIRDAEFTHSGDMCTFETLIKTFGIKDKAVKKIAELVHDLDMKDDKFNVPEARGIEEILIGIRRTATGDSDALEKGMNVFEMLYASVAG